MKNLKNANLLSLLIILLPFISLAQTGCLSGNCINGYGEYAGEEGDTYEGYWLEGLRNGEGYYTWSDGSNYRGNFVGNVCEGKGLFVGANGNIMDGYFLDGQYIGTEDPGDYDNLSEYFDNEYVADTIDEFNELEEYYDEDFSDGYEDYENFLDEMTADKTIFLETQGVFDFVIEGFENSFEYLQLGVDTSNMFSEQYFSLVSFLFAKPAVINLLPLLNKWQWYNVIVEDEVYADAKQQYDNYINEIDNLQMDCCSLIKKYTQTVDANNESYTTSWTVTKVNEGFDQVYWNLQITAELYRQYYSDKFTFLIRVKDSSK